VDREINTSPEGDELGQHYERLLGWFRAFDGAVVAFSAGVDSTLVLKAALDALGSKKVTAVTARSPSLRSDELELGKRLAEMLGAEQVFLDTDELENRGYRANQGDRCYFCKQTLYRDLSAALSGESVKTLKEKHGLSSVLVDGTNLDDLSDLRPGSRAAAEAGVRHPLVEAGINKATVRALAEIQGLPNWDKPAMACLSSRLPQGTEVTGERLAMIDAAETAIVRLGFDGVRVRFHQLGPAPGGKSLARVELPSELIAVLFDTEIREKIVASIRRAGFDYATLDMEGYRTGGLVRSTS
jgi:uncharacterized protein